MSEAPQLLLVN